ncbi:MAG: choice-of-anchor L domain-containing protein [Crocinitomicaceae bacterium]|nr:choice-of-anchor L domain-containing protein [Crocinitomicaceae bacterium]
MTKRLIYSLFGFLFLISSSLNAQIQVTNTMTPSQLVNNVLMGFGVQAFNIKVNGNVATANTTVANATYFNSNNTSFPINSGVLLTTGQGIGAIGPNSSTSQTNTGTPYVSSDPHLNQIASSSVENGIVLEFDFIPSGDTISFNYMFGSEEYPEWVGSSYNDVFGFFLWGPGISGPYALAGYPSGGANIATLPGTTTPVTINSISPSSNSSYYVNNGNGAAYGNAIQYDGTTTLLSANASVQCGQTYHIKLAIANIGDDAYDSGVFLQANSFQSDAVQVVVATVSGDTTIFEGCTDANIYFIRPASDITDTLIINYTVGGTATMGTDYNNLINPVTFLPGQDTVVINITPIADGISDNNETIEITATIVNPCGDTITSTGVLVILDSVVIDLSFTDPTVFCINDSVPVTVSANNGFGPYTYGWSNGDVGATGYLATANTTQGTTQYVVTATDACGYTGSDTVTVTVNQTIFIDSILTTPANCQPIGTVSATDFPYGAHLQNPSNPSSYNLTFDWTYQNDTSLTFPNQSALSNLAPGWYVLELTDNVVNCSVKDSAFVNVENVPMAVITTDPASGCTPLEVTIGNGSQDANSFQWDLGNGAFGPATSSTSPFTQTFTQTTTIQLVASNGDVNCNDTTAVTITIVTCGCTDPTATNYNPNAVLDDGSCVYPIPTVDVPNVITLNGDGVNDQFFLHTEYAESIELIIVNRWGNKVFEGNGNQSVPPIWDGKDKSGHLVPEGVYFYRYKIQGKLGDELEGHGFITVVR